MTTPTVIERFAAETGDSPVVFARALNADEPTPRKPQAPRRTISRTQRRITLILVVLLSATMTWWGIGSGPTESKASNFVVDALCDAIMGPGSALAVLYGNAPQPQGINILSTTSEMLSAKFPPNQQFTAWEWYNNAGLRWTSDFSEITMENGTSMPKICMPFVEMADGLVSNTIFDISKMISTVMISMYGWLTLPEITTSLFEPVETLINGDGTTTGLYDGIFRQFLQLMIVFAAIWMLWVGLVKKRSREAVQGAIWTLFAATFGIVFLSQPLFFVGLANDITSGATQIAFATTSGLTVNNVNNAAGGSICSVSSGFSGENAFEGQLDTATGNVTLTNTNRVVQCIMYKALMYSPWAAGQFGTSPSNMTDMEIEDASVLAKVQEKFPGVNDLRVAQVNALAIDQNESLAEGYQAYTEQWPAIKTQAEEGPYVVAWSGRSGGRTMMALLALVASAVSGAVIIIFAFYILLLKVGFLMLVLVSPIFLTLGVIPGFGRRIALRWMETILGVVLKQIIAIFMLAILIGLYSVIFSSTTLPWLAQIILIFAVGIGTIMYRKQFMNMLNFIKLGGGGGLDQGSQQFQQKAKRAGTSAVAGTSGGVQGARADGGSLGGFVTGMVAGSMMGGRTRGLRAVGTGGRAGRAAVNRRNARDARDERMARAEQERAERRDTEQQQPIETNAPEQRPSQPQPASQPPLCAICRQPMSRTGRGDGAAWVCTRNHNDAPTAPNNRPDAGGPQPGQPLQPTTTGPAAGSPTAQRSTPSPAPGNGSGNGGGSPLPTTPSAGTRPSPAGAAVQVSPTQQRWIDDLNQKAGQYQMRGDVNRARTLQDKINRAVDSSEGEDPDRLKRLWDEEFPETR